jgi:hypothetical protein
VPALIAAFCHLANPALARIVGLRQLFATQMGSAKKKGLSHATGP